MKTTKESQRKKEQKTKNERKRRIERKSNELKNEREDFFH